MCSNNNAQARLAIICNKSSAVAEMGDCGLTQYSQGRGLPACHISSWSVQPFGHSARTLQTGQDRQTGQTDNGLIAYGEPFYKQSPKNCWLNSKMSATCFWVTISAPNYNNLTSVQRYFCFSNCDRPFTRRPAYSADRTVHRQFQATGQPVSQTQASDAITSRLPRYEAKCVQRRCFQCRSVPLRSDIKGTEPPPANILIPLERQLIALHFAADSFYIMKLFSRLFVLHCLNCPKDYKFRYFIPILRKLGAA